MNIRSYVVIIVIATLGLTQKMQAQTEANALPEIKVIARAQEDRILLRWAVNSPVAWRKTNRYGYTLERYTVIRDKKALPIPEKKIIGQRFMPAPLMEWEAISEAGEFGAIMAQALWGESFVVQGGGGLASIINIAEEQQQRFAFGLYAADQDFSVAQKAGLGYVDTTVKSNEKYLYRVISNVPTTEMEIQYGGVYKGIGKYEPLPEPVDFTAVFQDKATILSWNSKILKQSYNSYIIERAVQGEAFKKLGDVPYTATYKEKSNTVQTVYVDSISNNTPYQYRIKGVSSFGEIGPPSEIVSGEGKTVLKYVPHLISKNITSESDVTLTWEFPEEGNKDITGFTLKRSDTDRGGYSPVVTNIPPTARSVSYDKLRVANYFKITANGKNNNHRDSFSMLVQPIDSIPPQQPKGLEGVIDTTGVVRLKWKPNTEEDLAGYRIYRAHRKGEELSQLTQSPHENFTYTDTIGIKNLNPKVYYQIVAVDKRYNNSEPSTVVALTKPDLIPPDTPVFKAYTLEKDGVHLSWANSASQDVSAHYVYRKTKTDPNWTIVFQSPKFKNVTFVDSKVEEGNYYSYTMIARDQTGLESQPAPPVSIFVPKLTQKPAVKGFYASVAPNSSEILLSWRYKDPEVAEYELYRAYGDTPSSLYQILPKGSTRFIDQELTINTTYTYIIRAVFTDGSYSKYNKFTIHY